MKGSLLTFGGFCAYVAAWGAVLAVLVSLSWLFSR